MSQENEDISIFLIISNQEGTKGFSRALRLPSGENVNVHVSAEVSPDDEKKPGERADKVHSNDLLRTLSQSVCIGIVLGILLTGIFLYTIGRLPSAFIIGGATLGAILTLIVSAFGVLYQKLYQPIRKGWHNPQSLIGLVFSLLVITGICLW
jgi:hypothetical protein